MIPSDWTPHRRPDDRELVGWIRPEAGRWVAVSLLGWDVTEPVDWLVAEEALERVGLSHLADVWMLERDAQNTLRVRLVEVNPRHIVVQTDDFGAIDVPVERFELPWPAPPSLRPRTGGDASVSPWG